MTAPESAESITEPEFDRSPQAAAILSAAGIRIREARERAGRSQRQLADVLDVTQTAVSYWETGKRDLGVTDLVRLADALDVTASSLLPVPPWVPAPDPQPAGRYGRIEIPGYRENEGWISEETRFGLQVAVVRDAAGTETAAIGMGPLCRVVWLPVPAAPGREPVAALPPGGEWAPRDDDDEYPGAF